LTLEPLDVGGTVSLTVTATNAAGQASVRSAKTAEIEPGPVNVTVGRPQDNGPTVTVPIGCDDDISCVVTHLVTALGAGGNQSADMATVARAQPKKPQAARQEPQAEGQRQDHRARPQDPHVEDHLQGQSTQALGNERELWSGH
jgi:hypothetical protein